PHAPPPFPYTTLFRSPVATVGPLLEEKHRAMLTDLHLGLTQQGDRLGRNLADSSERLSAKIDQRLDQIAGKVDERLDEGFKKTKDRKSTRLNSSHEWI